MKCKVRDILINYYVKGSGKPVFIIHGYAADHRLMKGCLEPVFCNVEGYKRIYIDLPGMGESTISKSIVNADVMLDYIIDFINIIIPDDNFLLIGESYGGYLSRGIIYNLMDRIDGLLLICPVIVPDMKKRNVQKHVVLSKDNDLFYKLNIDDAEDFYSNFVIQNEENYKRYVSEILSGIRIGKHDFLRNFKKNGYSFSFNVDSIDKKFNKPSLVLLGHQDSIVGYKDAWSILNNYPRATFAVIDRAGHNLQIEQNGIFNYMVNEWISRVEENKI